MSRGTSRRARRPVRLAVAGAVLGTALVATANGVVLARTSDRVTSDADDLEPAQVAIVHGSFVHGDGSLGRVVAERVDAAV